MESRYSFSIKTKGFNDTIDITSEIEKIVKETKIKEGFCLIFCSGSTVGITTIEAEPNLIADFKEFLDDLVSTQKNYRHNKTWGDGNAPSHIRSSLIKPFFCLPVKEGNLLLGTWQQVVLIDFDNRPREREIFVKVIKG